VRQSGSDGIVGACTRLPRRAEVDRSEEVRDFYERMPYPAPLTSLDGHRDLYKNRAAELSFI